MRVLVVSAALALAVSGCSKSTDDAHGAPAEHGAATDADAAAAPKKVDREAVDPDGVVRRGAMTEGVALTVAELAAKSAELDGKVVKVAGKVDSVCQPMGCWFVMTGDAGETVRVSSKGHDVFMPKSSAGRMATAVGEFKVRTLSKEQAQHFEDEKELKEGEARKVFTEDVKEFSLSLTGIELRPAT